MHWIDVVAEELMKKDIEHVIASGTSISGQPHIGSAEDPIIADAIARTIIKMGGKAIGIWIRDDLDQLRKIPVQIPQSYEKYIGTAVAHIPCPEGNQCKSFVDHFADPFILSLKRIGVNVQVYSGAEMYKTGMYDEAVKVSVNCADLIKNIFTEVSGAEKEAGWIPFQAICNKCGKIGTTKATSYQDGKFTYECIGGIADRKEIPGCGCKGECDIKSGKLQWRVEWAARWKILGITCEPFGKDHAAAGGSYDTCKRISSEVFNYPPPYPVVYEWVVFGGKRLKKSTGHVITLDEFISCATPEITRYFFFRSKAWKHREFDIGKNLLTLIDDYERTERIYFDIEKNVPEKEIPDIKRSYELSQVNEIPEEYFQIPYSHLIPLAQIAKNWNNMLDILRRTENISQLTEKQDIKLKEKADAVKYWLDNWAPDEYLFSVQQDIPNIKIDCTQVEILHTLSKTLNTIPWNATDIHTHIYEQIKKLGIEPKKSFEGIYKVILGQDRGPRVGYFLASLDKEFVLKRFGETPL